METILFIAEPIGLCLGSLAAGILACWLLWEIFKLVRHPAWGPPLVVMPVILGLAGKLPDSQFLKMSLVFALVAAVPFWSIGREWRATWLKRDDAPADNDALLLADDVIPFAPPPLPPSRRYPAITACMCEGRRPARGEVKKVALRIWRESFAARKPDSSFATRRALLRAARASLEGS